jgi:hypothetical protein
MLKTAAVDEKKRNYMVKKNVVEVPLNDILEQFFGSFILVTTCTTFTSSSSDLE